MTREAELRIDSFEIFADGLDHPEGLAFDRKGHLWAGGEAGQIYQIDPAGSVKEVANLGAFCVGVAFSLSGDLFVCNAKLGVVRVQPDGKWEVFAQEADGNRIKEANFPLFDRSGRLYVTDSGNWEVKDGWIYRFDSEGRGQVLAGPFQYANGMALSQDERSLFLVESDTATVYEISLDAEGNHTGQRILARDVGRVPDGLALDSRGNLFVTCYASDDIYRIAPEGGLSLVAHDPFGFRIGGPTNLAFGVSDPETIYVANLSRQTITRARTSFRGLPLVHLKEGL